MTVLEAGDKPGKKLLATGNGRCNLTNVNQGKQYYHGSDQKEAWKIIQKFPMSAALQFFSRLGIYTKNKNGWLYPNSEQAQAVLDVLLMEAAYRKVKIKTRERVREIVPTEGIFQVKTDGWTYRADRVILTCGSPASAVEGACRDGVEISERLGLTTIPMMPALTGLSCRGNGFSRWAGVRVHGTVTLVIQGNRMRSESGEIQLTDYGVSGIPVFQLSRYAVRALEEGCSALVELDFLPDFTEEQLRLNLEMRQENCPYKSLREQFVGLLPSRLIPVVVPKEADLSEVIRNCKRYPAAVKGANSMRQAQVCSGGVLLENLDENLQSLRYPGLYLAGEVLDVDGACGGYNLQWAWSSGAVAGLAAAREVL